MPVATLTVFPSMIAAVFAGTDSNTIVVSRFKVTPGGTAAEGADFALPTALAVHSCPCVVSHVC